MAQRIAVLALVLAASCASGATLEQLVMPGPVIEGHAEIEAECSNCHAPFSRESQDALCLACHTPIRDDLSAKLGFHGRGSRAGTSCKQCHTEHKGRSAEIAAVDPMLFDHAATDYPLEGAHRSVGCESCHVSGRKHRDTVHECAACHREDEPHEGRLGDDCAGCHDVNSWKSVKFDHATTGFDLTGAHTTVACGACHVDERYEGIERACASCHALDDVHKGARGGVCADCHTTRSWKTQRFDHFKSTGFALLGGHATLACDACHGANMSRKNPPKACNDCHSVDDPHAGRFGPACGDCHDNVDPHEGALGDCAGCHRESTWHQVTFNHDLTAFPLIGHHRPLACEACHRSSAFSRVDSQCVDCHRDDDYHHGAFDADCSRCHNPNGWSRWLFDHDRQTDFALAGAHAGLACEACHSQDRATAKSTPTACGDCHRRDDVHKGSFGADCGRCHTVESFTDLSGFRQLGAPR